MVGVGVWGGAPTCVVTERSRGCRSPGGRPVGPSAERLTGARGGATSARSRACTSLSAPGRLDAHLFLGPWLHTVSMGAVPASQFHKGPSGGQSQAGACRDRGGSGGGLEGLVAEEHVPGGDQDLARDRGLGGVGVPGAAADVEVELVPG